MRALIIDDDVREKIKALCEYADAHRLDRWDMVSRVENPSRPPIGNDPQHKTIIPMGYTCVYSIEDHPMPVGWSRHLSISVDMRDKVPSPEAIAMIMVEFGFSRDFARVIATHGQGKPPKLTAMWIEDAGARQAINLVEAL